MKVIFILLLGVVIVSNVYAVFADGPDDEAYRPPRAFNWR